ncbi:hypothetical protein B0H10DRAFT_2236242 [Mycena sp. CBHHK59/15]|nr:hypothetical protein B0H10DRAFT_2236242 [Mycena sp. CBHHK59/15]
MDEQKAATAKRRKLENEAKAVKKAAKALAPKSARKSRAKPKPVSVLRPSTSSNLIYPPINTFHPYSTQTRDIQQQNSLPGPHLPHFAFAPPPQFPPATPMPQFSQHIVAFIPNSPSFLSGRADDGLTIKALTDKYGPEVFKNYDLDYRTDDSGESVGSRDSNDEESDADGESAGSFISDDEGAMDRDGDAYGSEDAARNTTSFATSYDMDLEAEIFDAPSSSSDESV